jgi:exosome complex RNA-binding protein Rrp42 (RNase PH superfamily)
MGGRLSFAGEIGHRLGCKTLSDMAAAARPDTRTLPQRRPVEAETTTLSDL